MKAPLKRCSDPSWLEHRAVARFSSTYPSRTPPRRRLLVALVCGPFSRQRACTRGRIPLCRCREFTGLRPWNRADVALPIPDFERLSLSPDPGVVPLRAEREPGAGTNGVVQDETGGR